MIDFLIILSGCIGICAAVLAGCFGYHADICKTQGSNEEASKYFKYLGICIGYIVLWVFSLIVIPIISCFI